ncbi:hypothetical protein BRAO375_1000014 [Bradyrhizobium sp. ORS 375]|nr:hypothetical protein BRAO375_1000014 [Bradyrhizobium sp. ORS 375]
MIVCLGAQPTNDLSAIRSVMPGLVPGIHVVLIKQDDVDGRDKPGHDEVESGVHLTPIVKRDGYSGAA